MRYRSAECRLFSDTAAIELARSTCAVLGRGGSADDALYHVAQNDAVRKYPNNKDQEVKNLQAFTSFAVGVYCPQLGQ